MEFPPPLSWNWYLSLPYFIPVSHILYLSLFLLIKGNVLWKLISLMEILLYYFWTQGKVNIWLCSIIVFTSFSVTFAAFELSNSLPVHAWFNPVFCHLWLGEPGNHRISVWIIVELLLGGGEGGERRNGERSNRAKKNEMRWGG